MTFDLPEKKMDRDKVIRGIIVWTWKEGQPRDKAVYSHSYIVQLTGMQQHFRYHTYVCTYMHNTSA